MCLSPAIGFKGIGLRVRSPTPPRASSITSSEWLSRYTSVFPAVKGGLPFLP